MSSPRNRTHSPSDLPTDFKPDWAKAPGAVILAELKARGLTQAEFALRTSLSAKHINQLVKGTATLSPDVAVALERTLDMPVEFWLKTEAMWRSRLAQVDSRARLNEYAGWFARFPKSVLLEKNVVSREDPNEVMVEKLLRFFGVTDIAAFEKVWLRPQASFKRSQHFEIDPFMTALWIRLAERAAEERVSEVAAFDPRRLRAILPRIPSITRQSMPSAFVAARELLETAGVLLVYVSEIADTRICGASRWLSTGHPVVALTNRNKRVDGFWFYLAHELGHITLHPGRATFIDQHDKSVNDDKDEQESAADEFAQNLFISPEQRHLLDHATVYDLERLADEWDVSVSIVAGQFAHRHKKWSAVSKLRPTVGLDALLSGVS
jgi:HTH-type transcriptional regulator/antitoxin HigA